MNSGAYSIYNLVEETAQPSVDTYQLLGKRILEQSNSFVEHFDKIIPLFSYGMKSSSQKSGLSEIIQDLSKKVLKFGSN